MEEAAVPLVVIESVKNSDIDWNSAITERHDASSQFQIFPSLLLAMGYEKTKVKQMYGPSLIDADRDPMTFAVRMYLRLGPEPSWSKVDPKKVYRPVD